MSLVSGFPDKISLECFVCRKTDPLVKQFKGSTLQKCKLSLRSHIHHKLRYSDTRVPQTIKEGVGYHSQCYSNFNALNEKYRSLPQEGPSEISPVSANGSGEFFDASYEENNVCPRDETIEDESDLPSTETLSINCFFCPVKEKRYKSRKYPFIRTKDYSRFDKIKEYATIQEDFEVLEKLSEIETQNEILVYHSICAKKYRTRFQNSQKRRGLGSTWNLLLEKRENAYTNFRQFILTHVVKSGKSFFYSFLKDLFLQCLHDEVDKSSQDIPNAFSVEGLKEKILNDVELNNRVKFIKRSKKLLLLPKSSNLENFNFDELIRQDVIGRAAFMIRRDIIDMKKKELPDLLTATALIEGESEFPENLLNFYKYLLSGGNSRRRKSEDFKRKTESLAQDAIYNVSNGRVKTSKHITLGMAMKSLTSSKTVVDILNSLGHCCSYTTLMGLETEITYTSVQSNTVCPNDIHKVQNLNTGLAYDNFDKFVETVDGKDTLHDTVGIIFQDIYMLPNPEAMPIRAPTDVVSASHAPQSDNHQEKNSKRRRRTFQALDCSLEPYNKRPRIHRNFKPLDSHLRNNTPSNYADLKNIYTIWMLSFFMQVETPMWVGFNSKIIEDTCKRQNISYLTPLNESPTDDSVVLGTLKQAQQVAEECHEKYAQVTYDLAVAMKALNIQKSSGSRFDNVFIHLGTFHVMMSYFKGLGKFIDGSGIESILVDSGILANGSVSSFLSGKHFHRGKRLYPLIALGLEMIHFEYFLDCNKDIGSTLNSNEDVLTYLETFQNTRSASPRVDNNLIIEIFAKYDQFRQETLEGQHGKTGQYCLIYCTLVSFYLEFCTSIRTGNYQLFLYAIPKICNLFFSFNHQNYSRWLVQYHENLISVDDTHPGLVESFRNGSFGIKRTDKPYSKIPVDLTLEQTINADAARSLTGISHFTNSLAARQRWCISHGVRTSILSHIYDVTGVKRKQEMNKDLTSSRIKKDNLHLIKFIDAINNRLNPFSPRLKVDKLYHLSTGQTAPDEIANFLLGVLEKGDELRKTFISECINDEKNERFDKAIKRVPVANFAILRSKKKMQVGKKIQEVTIQRDLFGRLLAISLENKIDLEIVMKYPITPVPNVFCHMDGQLHKTDKSVLAKILEVEIEDSFAPEEIDQYIVDGFFFLYLVKNDQLKFGHISLQILEKLCSLKSQRIDIVFDTYPEPSIKDREHKLRENLAKYDGVIQEHLTLRNSTFTANLKDKIFKEKFVEFLVEHWTCPEAAKIIGDKVINLNFKKCYTYRTSLRQVIKYENYDLTCRNHEEADTKIIHHAYKSHKKIVIKCSDTDVLIILLANMDKMDKSAKIWVELGVSTKRRFINASKLYEKLGSDLSHSLPAFHAFTGCDFNPCFHQKGKKRPFNLLRKSEEFQKAFKMMSSPYIIRYQAEYRKTLKIIEKFVCLMYGLKNEINVNEARLAVFSATYKPKKTSEKLLKELFKYDSSRLPPCEAELEQQFRRATYVAQLWSGAYLKVPTDLEPLDWGWILENGGYDFNWYLGEALPAEVGDIIISGTSTEKVSGTDDDNSEESSSDSESEDDSEDKDREDDE